MPLINIFKRTRPGDVHIDFSSQSPCDEPVDSETNISETMNRSFMAKVWHAFMALSKNERGLLDRAKAKVLTQSLASVMQLSTPVMKDFEESFPNEKFTTGVRFEEFRTFINSHLLPKVIIENDDETCFEVDADADSETAGENDTKPPKKVSEPGMAGAQQSAVSDDSQKKAISWDLLDQVCWTLYSKQALSPRYFETLSDNCLYSLWLWFNTFADADAANIVQCPVIMDCEEMNYWMQYLFGELLALDFQPIKFPNVVSLNFIEVVDALLSLMGEWNIDKEELQFVIHEFKLEMIDGVIKKGSQLTRGFLYKGKRNLMKSQWKRRYCALTLKTFSYYTDENMTEKKGQIPLSQIISADPYRDRNSKLTRYQMETNNALFILEAEDLRSRNQWIRDIRYAIRCNQQMVENVHIIKAEKRKKEREQQRENERRAIEEKQRFNERIQQAEEANEELNKEIMNVKSELEREEQQRLAEERAREQITQDLHERLHNVTSEMNAAMERISKEKEEQQQALENERLRVAELQAMRAELETALEEEQKLRKQEESVMKMQAALVEEQTKAREKLEEMKCEQEQLLGMEIQKRTNIQVELDSQKEVIARTEDQLNQFLQDLKESEAQKAELYKKMKELEEKMKASQTSFTIGSHRGKGAFPSIFSRKN